MENKVETLQELANLNPPQVEFSTRQMKLAMELVAKPLCADNPLYAAKPLCADNPFCQIIHIAGSNGKGSTAAFIEAGLILAGFRVGKFSSPYIHRLNECIVVDNQEIADDDLAALYLEFKPVLRSRQIYLSSFEMLTFLMFIYFARQKVDYLVLETGMGGRDDATNVVDSHYNVITNVSLEHTQWLGTNLAEIAAHKAGIITAGKTIIADNTPELLAAVAARTANFCNVLSKYQFASRLDLDHFTTQLVFSVAGSSVQHRLKLGLFGHFQVANFLAAYEVLTDIGISNELIFAAAAKTRWNGRLQLLQRYPRIVADAAHNPDGCAKLAASLCPHYRREQVVIICSMLRDKDQSAMLKSYSQIGASVIFCRLPRQPRATPPRDSALLAAGLFQNVYVADSAEFALRLAKRLKPHLILISGSIYLLNNFIAVSGKPADAKV